MISPYQVLQESGFSQYTAMVRFTYNRENTSLGAEKLAEMVRAIPGSTRVSTVSLDKDSGIAIFSVKLISTKNPKGAFIAFKENALKKFKGMLLKVEVGAGTIEKKGDFILMKESQEESRPSHLKQYLGQMLEEDLLLEVSIDELRRQYVDSNKLPENTFNRIVSACNNQSNYATWLCKKIVAGICSEDAIETWGERFAFFDQYKSRFQTKDINTLKTAEQIQDWVINELNPVARDVFKKGISGGSQVDDTMIEKLEKCRVSDFKSQITDREYYVFRVGKDDFDVEHYLGSGTNWCTRNNEQTFQNYINYPDSSGVDGVYWIFVNKDNQSEKWQLLYKANYFCDRKDRNFLHTLPAVPLEMLKFLRDRYNQQFPSSIQQRIQNLERSIDAPSDTNRMTAEEANQILSQNLIGTESSYKAYRFPVQRPQDMLKVLVALKLAKSETAAKVLLDELDREPLALIVNSGSKKALPIYVGLAGGQLIQADNSSKYFPSIKNENEYKLLLQIQESVGSSITIDNLVHNSWNARRPSLSEFRFNGRDDVWKFDSTTNVHQMSRAASQLLTQVVGPHSANSDTLNLESLYRNFIECVRGNNNQGKDTYVIRVGHNTVATRNDISMVDTGLTPLGPVSDCYLQVQEKMDRVGVPYTLDFEDSDPSHHSEFFLKVYRSKFNSLESLDRFKIQSPVPESNEKWDLYRLDRLSSTSIWGYARNNVISFRSRDGEESRLVGFSPTGGVFCFKVNPEGIKYIQASPREVLDILRINPRSEEDLGLLSQTLVHTVGRPLSGYRYLRRFSKNLSNDLGNAQIRNRVGVPQYLREHEEDLGEISFAYSRRGRGRVSVDRGIRLSWEQARPILGGSSPAVEHWIYAQEAAGKTPFDVFFWLETDRFLDWNSVVRLVEEVNGVRQVTGAAIRTGAGESLVWRRIENIPEQSRITVDENGNEVGTQTGRTVRQARTPRSATQPTAPQETAPELSPESQQQLRQFGLNTANSDEAYRASSNNAVQILETLGFTHFAEAAGRMVQNDREIHTVVYRICPHRHQTAQRVAILFADGFAPVVGSVPKNSEYAEAVQNSTSWRLLTRELDNSVHSFQQLYDICEELHIPQTIAIQHWPNNRANRQ